MTYRETEHLRVLIANERKDRLALVAPIVVAIVVLGEAAQDDVDGALPVLDVGVADVGEDASLGRLLDEVRIARVDEGDHRAGGLLHDLVDQSERMVGALPESDQRDIGPLPRGHRTDVFNVDFARDHLVPEFSRARSDAAR
jgi:hypothetical protein